MVAAQLQFGSTFMQIKFNINEKDTKKIEHLGEIDWKRLSYATTLAYNWCKPNRVTQTYRLPIKIKESPGLAGWYSYGNTLYVNLEFIENLDDFLRTVFHEFRHWVQYKIEKRSSFSLVTKRKNGWDMDNAESEAETWEKIGIKIFEIYNILDYIKKEHEYNCGDNKGKH